MQILLLYLLKVKYILFHEGKIKTAICSIFQIVVRLTSRLVALWCLPQVMKAKNIKNTTSSKAVNDGNYLQKQFE